MKYTNLGKTGLKVSRLALGCMTYDLKGTGKSWHLDEEGVGVIPWSPLARGRLARPWKASSSSGRVRDDEIAQNLYADSEAADKKIIDHVGKVANVHGISRAQVALAWLLHQPAVTAPIIGATQLSHLDDAVASLEVKLNPNEVNALTADYIPHTIVGFE